MVEQATDTGGIDAECLCGLGVAGERMPILLDIERLMASPDMGLVTAQPQLRAA